MVFSCKQFQVSQAHCAMKITTSALIFGAYIEAAGHHFLEIGAGTGILSLMLAQRSQARILSLEIEPEAALTAQQNFSNSPWNNRLSLITADASQWYLSENQKFDLIFSNPPFYIEHLHSSHAKKNLARHDSQQLNKQLAPLAKKLLTPSGAFWLLTDGSSIPFLSYHFEKQGFFPYKSVYVHTHPAQLKPFAVIAAFVQKPIFHTKEMLYTHNEDRSFSDSYKNLLKDFLLFL